MPTNNPLIFSFILVVVGLAVILLIALRPRSFWPTLMAISIIPSGMMVIGYSIIDEYLLGCFLFGIFIYFATSKGTWEKQKNELITRVHMAFYLLLMLYLIFQSVRGSLVADSPQKMRWVVLYLMLLIIVVVINMKGYKIQTRRQMAIAICVSTLIYLLIYIFHGLTAKYIRQINWVDLQTVEWGTTAYSLLPVALAIPAALICIQKGGTLYKKIGWTTLFTITLTAFFYDSRIVLLCLLGFVVVALPIVGIKTALKFLTIFTVLLFVFISLIWPSYRDLQFFKEDLFGSGSALWEMKDSSHDKDRALHMKVAFTAINNDWDKFLIGYGFRMHGYIISPYLRDMYEEYIPDRADLIKDDESTEAFTALVVDTGVIGLFLILANFIIVSWQVVRSKNNEYRFVLMLALSVFFVWLFIINITDIILLYLAIMPSGPLLQMAQSDDYMEMKAIGR